MAIQRVNSNAYLKKTVRNNRIAVQAKPLRIRAFARPL
jgi:hypothetical protein